MADADRYIFTYKEIAEALVRKQGLNEGLWMIYVEFGIQGANAGPAKDQAVPTAIVPLLKFGLQRIESDNPFADSSLVVDAAVVNPAKS